MKSIQIYQTISGCKYSFMNYEFAKKIGIKDEDYNLVASFEDETEEDDYTILNKLWNIGNDGTLQQQFRMRSISVSDIILIDEKSYYVDSFGFKEVE